jgi:branched-chain amino acid transport system substrate-binding protein
MLKKLALALLATLTTAALADINIGVSVSATGPAASLGIPEKNSIALLPTTMGGQKVNYIVLDDASDPTAATRNIKKFVSENKIDVVIGSTITPNSLAMMDVAVDNETPIISMAGSAIVVEPMDAKRQWVFKTAQNDAHMATALVQHMTDKNVQTVAFIGFADAYGEGWYKEFAKIAEARKLKIVASERYQRNDTSVTGQILKIMATKPDAILVGGAGTPAALPQKTLKEKGYKGLIYQTHGVANNDFLRIGGKDVEGAFLPVGPMVVAAQLPADNPVRKSALEYVSKYEAAYGKGSVSSFGGHAWDAGLLLQNAVPLALKKGKPGTVEFRRALRDALEATKNLAGAHGIFNLTPNDHQGFDQRARVMVTIENNTWKLIK